MNGPKIIIGDKEITDFSAPYLIAEIGVNYYDIAKKENISLMEAAKLMVKEAWEAGCDAAKFQSYKADTLAAEKSPAYWDTTKETTKSQHELFQKFDKFGETEFEELKNYCNELGIEFLSTPFDIDSVHYLDRLVSAYKIASADITNYPMLKVVAAKHKPVLLSTGASKMSEVDDALGFLKEHGNEDICLMHCVLNYPTVRERANLASIKMLRGRYPNRIIGYSDHVLPDKGLSVLQDAYLLGAVILEKHFTLDKSLPGNDHYHAMDPTDVRKFREAMSQRANILGSPRDDFYDFEAIPRKEARRGTYATRDLRKGDILTEELFIMKRPAAGIATENILKFLGKKIAKDIKKDNPIEIEDLI
jgi:N-acetylneuraminate synthase